MAAAKLITILFGLLLVVCVVGFFEPGPIVNGLGPVFDQIVTRAVTVVLVALVVGGWIL
jgi:hypothetical protein